MLGHRWYCALKEREVKKKLQRRVFLAELQRIQSSVCCNLSWREINVTSTFELWGFAPSPLKCYLSVRFVLWALYKKGSLLLWRLHDEHSKVKFMVSYCFLPTLSCMRISMGSSFLQKLLYIHVLCFTTNDLKQSCLHPALLYLHGHAVYLKLHEVPVVQNRRLLLLRPRAAVPMAVVSFTLCT